MLDKFRNLGGQLTDAVGSAASTVASSVKGGVDSAASATVGAVQAAGEKVGALGNKVTESATREAMGQLRTLLAVATEELTKNPVSDKPVTLIAKMDVVVAALEVHVVVDPPAARGPAGTSVVPRDE
ncbi:MAG: hypothetical protein MUF03_02045 [Rubrivivax sp.]|jgi:hypothetical protein|nr:hypothetical protein [Rubrivivax sp.]